MKRQICNQSNEVIVKVNPFNIVIMWKYKKKVKERKANTCVVITKVLVIMPEVVNRGNANNFVKRRIGNSYLLQKKYIKNFDMNRSV